MSTTNLKELLNKYKSNVLLDHKTIAELMRIQDVYDMWEHIVEPFFLEHTNAVFIFSETDKRNKVKKILVVYLDDSLFSSELHARRQELIFRFAIKFNEYIDEARILTSKGMYKKKYPFLRDKKNDKVPGVVYKDIFKKNSYVLLGDKKEVVVPLQYSEEVDNKDLQDMVNDIKDEKIKKSALHALKAVNLLENELKNN